MNNVYRRAESILEVATAAGSSLRRYSDCAGSGGSLRVMSSEGWTLRGLIQEFGAAEVYMVQRLSGSVTVEGWTTSGQCTLSKRQPKVTYIQTLQVTPRLAA